MTQSGGIEYSLGTATLTLRGDMQPLERDLARMRAVIAEMEKRGVKIDAPDLPPPSPETQRGYEDLTKTIEGMRRSIELNGESLRQLNQGLSAAGGAAGTAAGGNGFGGAAASLLSMGVMAARLIPVLAQLESVQGAMVGAAVKFGLVSKSIPILGAAAAAATPVLGGLGKAAIALIPGLGQVGLAAIGLNAIFGVMAAGATAAMAPLQQLSAEAGRLNKQVAEAGIFAAQSFAILGPDGKLVEGTARQMQMVRGAILKEYRGIQQEVANISGATAGEIYDGFNIILQNVSALGEKGTLENSAKLATRIAAGMNTLGIPAFQLRQEVNAVMMGNIGPDALLAKKLNITSDDARRQQAQGTYYDFLMKKLEKLYEGQKVLALSLANVKSNFDDVNQAIASQSGQPLERDTAQMMQTILVTFKNLQGSFSGLFKSIAEAVGPIIKLFGPIVSVFTSIGAMASSVGRIIMDVVGTAAAALGMVLQPALVAIARFVEFLAKGFENIASAIGGAINPIKALFNASADANADGVNGFFDSLIKGAEGAGRAVDEWNRKWAQTVLDNRLANMRANMMAAGASEKEIAEAQTSFRENFNRQTGLTEEVELRSLQLDPKSKAYLDELNNRLGTGSARALNISKAWSEIKQKAYQNEIKALEQGLTLMSKQKDLAEAISSAAAARRALEARGYELGVQVAASPEAKAAAEARLADLKLQQETETIAERRGILQTERELQQRQMMIQEKQVQIQQEQLKIQLAEARADQVRVDEATKAAQKARANTKAGSPEWQGFTRELNVLAAERTRNAARVNGAREAIRLAFEAEGQLSTTANLQAQVLGLQEQQLDIQGQSAQYTRQQQALLAQISQEEQQITNNLTRATIEQNRRKQGLESQTEEINRQNTLRERQGRLEKAQADLAATRAKAEVQAAQRLAEIQELQDRARSGGGTASVIEAQIAAAAAGVIGMETAAQVQERLYQAKEHQMTREHALQQRQLEVQQKREESEVRIQRLQMEIQRVGLALQRAQLASEIARLTLQQQRDAIAPSLAGAPNVPALAGISRLPRSISGRLDASGQNGADMPVGPNNEMRSYHNGVVTEIGRAGNNGNYTVIEFIDELGNKLEATYSHMAAIVKVGQQVVGGQVLGRFDASGRTFGAHSSVDINSPGTNGSLQRNAETAAARRSADLLVSGKVQGQVSAGGTVQQLAAAAQANMAGYLNRLSYLETRIRNVPNAQGSGAQGYFQTMNAFHQEAIAASGGLNSRSGNYQESSAAVAAWMRKHRPAAFDHIKEGRFDAADAILRHGTWPSLPGGSQAQPEAIQQEARKFLPTPGSVARTVAAAGGAVAPSTALQAQDLQQRQQDLNAQDTRLSKAIEDLNQWLQKLGNAQALETENLTEQQLADRAQFEYERVRAQLTAQVMKTPDGRLAIATGDAVSSGISSSVSGALQALLNGGDVRQAVTSALAQAGQALMQATLDSLLNPLLSQMQGGLVKALTGIDIEGRSQQVAAASMQSAAGMHMTAANALLAAAGALGAGGAGGGTAGMLSTLASRLPSLLGGIDLSTAFTSNSLLDFGSIPTLVDGAAGIFASSANAYTPGRAGGGEIQYGLDYLVGERNAEIVRFNKSGGKVFSNRALTKALGVPFQRTPGGGTAVASGADTLGGLNTSIPFLKSSGNRREELRERSRGLHLSFDTQVINSREYATVEQLREAAAAAAQAGRDSVYSDLRNSPSVQQSLGLR